MKIRLRGVPGDVPMVTYQNYQNLQNLHTFILVNYQKKKFM